MYAGTSKPEVYWSDEEDEDDEENKAKAAARAAEEEGLTRRQRRAAAVNPCPSWMKKHADGVEIDSV